MQTIDNKLGEIKTAREEVRSMYMAGEDADSRGRFVVSLVVPYGGTINDGIESAEQAGAAAVGLVHDSGSEGTMWMVFDRQTETTHIFQQADLYEIALMRGMVA